MPPKILIVDDEPKWLRVVSLYLQARHYEVLTARSALEALERIRHDHPDLVIADICMPDVDGYELCSRLRRDAYTRALPFIFLTGKDHDADRIKARKIGSDDYLTKPCSLERLIQSVEAVMDRLDQARRIPLDTIGPSGLLEDVDLLDLIQMLELEQRTGALVLSHGERTATLYLKDGAIVDAEIRSPKREEPLFVLLGWKTGRYLFLPDVLPERMPITASVANLLLEDLRVLERHERREGPASGIGQLEPHTWSRDVPDGPAARIVADLEEGSRRLRSGLTPTDGPTALRLLIAGVRRSGKSELIHGLVKDLSHARWAAVGIEQSTATHVTDFGRVRTSQHTVLHLIAVRAEKRFWPLWEQCLPGAHGILLLIHPHSAVTLDHLRSFLRARQALAPMIPLRAILSTPGGQEPTDAEATLVANLEADLGVEISIGDLASEAFRLEVLERLLQQSLTVQESRG
jgi:DNA-binding response OmpR family regulator